MHQSKLQGKRSLGLSALLAQRHSDVKPAGPPQSPGDEHSLPEPSQSPGDERSHEARLSQSENSCFPLELDITHETPIVLSNFQQALNLSPCAVSEVGDAKSILQNSKINNVISTIAGVASWDLCGDQNSGAAKWQMTPLVANPLESRPLQTFRAMTLTAGPSMKPNTDVNIFHQNSRDISAIFVEKQKKIILELNGATASLKLQLQAMQQERDDAFVELSILQSAIEEQRHEQQTQQLSFTLKMLQDEAEMRKLNDKIHTMQNEIDMFRQCFQDIGEATAASASGSLDSSIIFQKVASIHSRYITQDAQTAEKGAIQTNFDSELISTVDVLLSSLDQTLASQSHLLRPILEDMDKKYLEQQLKKEFEIAQLNAQIQQLEALNINLHRKNSHAIFDQLAIDEVGRKNARKCEELETIIAMLQEEISANHRNLKDHDTVLLHCLRDINVVRNEYVTLETERKLQYQASERNLIQKMQLGSEQLEEMGAKLQNFRELLVQKESSIDDLRGRCEFLMLENGSMIKKIFLLESSCSDSNSALAKCKGELEIALLEKQMLTKIDDQKRLSQLQSSDSYHSQLEVDYIASQETIEELRKKCDHYQSSWFQYEKKAREERRDWQENKEQEMRLMMEVSLTERVVNIQSEMKILRQKLEDCKAAQIVELSTVRNQFARAEKQTAIAHSQRVNELILQNQSCTQRVLQLQQLCQALQKGNTPKIFGSAVHTLQ